MADLAFKKGLVINWLLMTDSPEHPAVFDSFLEFGRLELLFPEGAAVEALITRSAVRNKKLPLHFT